MRKKGFTLIELLAVIVILVIISLVAVPLILNVIEESKRGAAKESATNYVKQLENTLVKSLMDGSSVITKGLYTLDGNGNIGSPITLEVSMKGDKAKAGSVCVGGKGSVTSYSLKVGNYYITSSDGTNQEITDEQVALDCNMVEEKDKIYADGTAVYFNPETNQKCSEEEYQANIISSSASGKLITGCMKWYTFLDSNSASEVNIILAHSSTSPVVWNSSGNAGDGMKEVKEALLSDTSSWASGLNPRLITAEEVALITGNTSFDSNDSSSWYYLDSNNQTDKATGQGTSKYAWLFDYIAGCVNYGCNYNSPSTPGRGSSNGVWTSTACGSNAWNIRYDGRIRALTSKDAGVGIRPVVTISKSLLQSHE